MKRSEMIEHIAQELAVDEGLYKTAHHDYFQRKAADLLDMIEGFGMQPPKIEQWEEISGTFLGEGFKVMKMVNEWEPEQARDTGDEQ